MLLKHGPNSHVVSLVVIMNFGYESRLDGVVGSPDLILNHA